MLSSVLWRHTPTCLLPLHHPHSLPLPLPLSLLLPRHGPPLPPPPPPPSFYPSLSALPIALHRHGVRFKTTSQSPSSSVLSSSPAASPSSSSSSSPSSSPSPSAPPLPSSPSSVDLSLVYQKKTQREHILLRPEPYLGVINKQTKECWIVKQENRGAEGGGERNKTKGAGPSLAMCLHECSYSPALVHIFDEILVNAADNRHRNTAHVHQSYITCHIDQQGNVISVENDGYSIPISIHPTDQVYIPELIFGHLLTSSNYNDTEQRLTGGRHGYGAKLTNIFSTAFKVEIQDEHYHYSQVFRDNMSIMDKAIIKKAASKRTYTRITFSPDLQRFGEKELTDDTVALMKKRVYDVAACIASHSPKIAVSLNNQTIHFNSFFDYVALYPHSLLSPASAPPTAPPATEDAMSDDPSSPALKALTVTLPNGWELCVSPVSPSSSLPHSAAPLRDISFVNCIYTSRGGFHLYFLSELIIAHLHSSLLRHHKALLSQTPATSNFIRSHFSLFLSASVPNPSFSSQTKELLISPPTSFSPSARLPPAFLSSLLKDSGLIPSLVDSLEARQRFDLIKKSQKGSAAAKRGRQLNVPKLDDANWAGGPRSAECTLILTEGDSAKALVLSGIDMLGRDKYGVFPLRGKLLNVRDATHQQIINNVEIGHLMTILGLKHGETYESEEKRAELRYGSVMLMTDQDYDGSHIRGLLINILHTFWPQLLRRKGFLSVFVTALVKVRQSRSGDERVFHSLNEYKAWREGKSEEDLRSFSVKYYKGLGTNTAAEGREYFKNIDKHRQGFVHLSAADDEAILLGFSKALADARKSWLLSYSPSSTVIDTRSPFLSFSDFINKELIAFSNYDNVRSIPSLIDGLKPVQRKILFAAFKKKLTGEAKVAQFSGYVAEQTSYHHGEQSLHSSIINMAQDFVGSNNIPLLMPMGQFGTRNQGGADSASARYIFTRLNPLTRLIYREEDESTLEWVDEDGQQAEPVNYFPVIPTVLVNGTQGIGTGFSTAIPSFNPIDLVNYLRRKLKGESGEKTEIKPYYRGFKGRIMKQTDEEGEGEEAIEGNEGVNKKRKSKKVSVSPARRDISAVIGYRSEGIIHAVDRETVEISELPIGKWTQEYKEFLLSLLPGSYAPITIKRFHEYHTNDTVKFRIHLSPAELERAKEIGLIKVFKLSSSISLNNMCLFDENNRIKRYTSVEEIIDSYYRVRMECYGKRKEAMIRGLKSVQLKESNKIKFIESVIGGRIQISKLKKEQLLQKMDEMGFTPSSSLSGANETKHSSKGGHQRQSPLPSTSSDRFDYLLNMPLSSLTEDRINALRADHLSCSQQINRLEKTTPTQLWLDDLDLLEKELIKAEQKQISKSKREAKEITAE